MGSEWKEVTVNEIAAPVRNALVGGPFGSNLVSSDYVFQGVPVIRGQNLGARWVSGDFAYVSDAKADSLSANLARPGDIILTQRGTLGQVGLVPNGKFARYLVSQSQMKLTPDTEIVDPVFCYYQFCSDFQQDYIRLNSIQSGVPHTNLGILRRTPFLLPPLAEQRAIAHILGTLDDKIELIRKQNETLEAMARTLFKAWFVDFEPVRAKLEGRWQRGQSLPGLPAHLYEIFPDRLVESELGEVPKGWRSSSLGYEVEKNGGTIQTGPFGSQLHASDYVSEGVPVVMPKDIDRRRVTVASIARVHSRDAERLTRHRLRGGDIVFSRRGDVERHALIGEREKGWLCGTGCLLIRPGPDWHSSAFLSLALDQPSSRAWLVQHAVGATMPNLNTRILADVPLLMPSDAVLVAFSHIIRPLFMGMEAVVNESETAARLRNTLLPKLISGLLRVLDVERFLKARGL